MKKSPFPCKVYHEHKFGGFPYESRQGVGFTPQKGAPQPLIRG